MPRGRRRGDPRPHPGRPGPARLWTWAASRTPCRRCAKTTDLIVQLSTGGAVTDSFDDRLAVLDGGPRRLLADLRHGHLRRRRLRQPVAVHPRALRPGPRRPGWCPSSSCSTWARWPRLHRLLTSLGPPHGGHVHCDLVMGVPGGMPGTVARAGGRGGRAARRRDVVRHRDRAGHPCRPAGRARCRAATCGSAWRTPPRSPGAGPWRVTRNSSSVRPAWPRCPAAAAGPRRGPGTCLG